jgi:hypothetical protein
MNLFNPQWPTSGHLASQLIAQLMVLIAMLFLVSWQINDSLKNVRMFWPPVGGILKATDRLAPCLANLAAKLASELSERELETALLLIKCQRDNGRLFPTFLSFLVAISFVLPDPRYRLIAQAVTNVFLATHSQDCRGNLASMVSSPTSYLIGGVTAF